MARSTMDFGIDLGTTNSAIAVLDGTEARIVKNAFQHDTTPSAVYADRNGRIHVGERARERVESDPANAAAEFKLKMGLRDQATTFANSGLSMSPEELSAHVLRALKANVNRQLGEDIRAAVITVPAAFELNQTDATRRAAEAAGLGLSPLLQEPTAAALAYSFQRDEDNIYRLVFDLGGGTFDASVVHIRDGEFDIVNHRGDNFLGGKLIDWAIVEELLMPALLRQYSLPGFGRGEPTWAQAIAKLKAAAENAKIELSSADSALIDISDPPLCTDPRGNPVEFVHELFAADVDKLTEPFVARAINICQAALRESQLAPEKIDRVLLVGGPTLMPHLRRRLREGLGIELDVSQDPMTVVARGAAIFAGTQRLPAEPVRADVSYTVDLEYKPIGADPEPVVGGVVQGPADRNLEGFTVEFVNGQARPPWRSGQIILPAAGSFITTLRAEPGLRNTYEIVLEDPTGTRERIQPAELTYTLGVVAPAATLTHSIGVALAGNEVAWLLEKGTRIPARAREILRSTVRLTRGQSGGLLRIPILEGEHPRADRNRQVGALEILADQVARDIPKNSEIEVEIQIDASRLVTTKAYVPILDEEFEAFHDLTTETAADPVKLRRDLTAEQERYDALRADAERTSDPAALALLGELEDERALGQLENDVSSTEHGDADAAGTAGKRMLDLRAKLDAVEEALEWPSLVEWANRVLRDAPGIIDEYGDAQDRRRYEVLAADVRRALAGRDAAHLRTLVDELTGHLAMVVDRKTGAVVMAHFSQLVEQRPELRDQALAARLIAEGRRAVDSNDIERLRTVNRQLFDLLPSEGTPERQEGSSVRRSL
ncbi:2-alkenal reductase [Parafrankia sp. Ea1.12]|uniref:Hsp70 family protein n=1 Tax=Parafrankia sp. Ea1.12 TaxID=573499 RepID=UPI000DA44480|nr:Hsp70 family protein [Parafrankia sp. Ea1.12]SQD97514.1 2-alkenal reductase [Parafrankia sp. Ea1.12]